MNLPTVIFTDLDGTLLDHFSYKSTPAKATLKWLIEKGIPVVCNTSKTFAEVEIIREELGLNTPFVVENGAAIYIPKTYFNQQPEGTSSHGSYWVKTFVKTRGHWLRLIADYKLAHPVSFVGFNDLTTLQLADLTGLTQTKAKLAKQRQYSEPIQWLSDKQSKHEFINFLNKSGAQVLQGGRFIHISGRCDKGVALSWLTQQYRQHFDVKRVKTIALGDSQNDIAMLEVADVAVLVRSPVHDYPNLISSNVIRTNECGPKGWATTLNTLLINTLNNEVMHG